jgi:hypothetical protein
MTNRYAHLHTAPSGTGHARPTVLQIIQDNDVLGQSSGKVALVTGISSGIGIETARAHKATGMHVFGAVRNISKRPPPSSTISSPANSTCSKWTWPL